MLKRLLTILGLSAATATSAAPPYQPYKDTAANSIYNLLFCDDLSLYVAKAGEEPAPWQKLLADQNASASDLLALAQDAKEEGRIRALAFGKLRSMGTEVPRGVLLGVVAEIGLDGGLDTLAAFSDGGVRYLNQSAKMVIVEGQYQDTAAAVHKLLTVSQDAVNRLKPLDRPRLAPPPRGMVRFTFIASDGLYLGQGPMASMERDPIGAPISGAATELLLIMIKLGTK